MSKVIVGIDFGTSGIGYAFSFSGENPNAIMLSDFHGQNADNKVSSEIILDNNLEDVLSFGNECKRYIRTHLDKNKYEYFTNIKMNLYHKKYKIKSTNGKEADIELIIYKILKKVSEDAIVQIKRANGSIKTSDIKWIVTIPAIWEERSKQIMINASIKAGLIDKDSDKSLFLALEPEVAGIYYYIASSMTKDAGNNGFINEGKPYIICDIGAGTVDICTHRKVMKNNKVSELIEEYPPIGGDYGGQVINEEFIKIFIMEIFGEDLVKKLQTNTNDNEEWAQFEKEIEELKISCYENELNNLILDCSLFDDDSIDKTLNDYISEYDTRESKYKKYKIQGKKRWKLEFSSQIFIDIAKDLSRKIFTKIEEIYNNVHTGYIIMTGAGSKNDLITNYFYDFANEKNMKIEITIPPQREISIMKGAVLFGFQNDIIRKRKAKYSLGVRVYEKWDEKFKDKGIKSFSEIYKAYVCTNAFSKFITVNQYIKFNEVIRQEYKALFKNTDIIFYKTYKEICTFIDEKDENGQLIIQKFGKINFDIGEDYDINKRDIIIEMKLGGTYIDVSVIYEKTGKKIDSSITFN